MYTTRMYLYLFTFRFTEDGRITSQFYPYLFFPTNWCVNSVTPPPPPPPFNNKWIEFKFLLCVHPCVPGCARSLNVWTCLIYHLYQAYTGNKRGQWCCGLGPDIVRVQFQGGVCATSNWREELWAGLGTPQGPPVDVWGGRGQGFEDDGAGSTANLSWASSCKRNFDFLSFQVLEHKL